MCIALWFRVSCNVFALSLYIRRSQLSWDKKTIFLKSTNIKSFVDLDMGVRCNYVISFIYAEWQRAVISINIIHAFWKRGLLSIENIYKRPIKCRHISYRKRIPGMPFFLILSPIYNCFVPAYVLSNIRILLIREIPLINSSEIVWIL